MKALSEQGTLCLGLYRLHEGERSQSLNKRYVINFPPEDFVLEDKDLVYVLLQFEETKPSGGGTLNIVEEEPWQDEAHAKQRSTLDLPELPIINDSHRFTQF